MLKHQTVPLNLGTLQSFPGDFQRPTHCAQMLSVRPLQTASDAVCLFVNPYKTWMSKTRADMTAFHVVEVLELALTFFQVTHDPAEPCFPKQAFTE